MVGVAWISSLQIIREIIQDELWKKNWLAEFFPPSYVLNKTKGPSVILKILFMEYWLCDGGTKNVPVAKNVTLIPMKLKS